MRERRFARNSAFLIAKALHAECHSAAPVPGQLRGAAVALSFVSESRRIFISLITFPRHVDQTQVEKGFSVPAALEPFRCCSRFDELKICFVRNYSVLIQEISFRLCLLYFISVKYCRIGRTESDNIPNNTQNTFVKHLKWDNPLEKYSNRFDRKNGVGNVRKRKVSYKII